MIHMRKPLILLSVLISASVFFGCENTNDANDANDAETPLVYDSYTIANSYYDEDELTPDGNGAGSDYIMITNANNSLEPQQLKVGEEFLGWRLDSIGVREVPIGDTWHTGIVANFSGEIVVSGELQYHSWPQVPFTPFMVHEQYWHLFPRLANDIDSGVFINPIYLLHEATMATLAAHNVSVLWQLVNSENPVVEMTVRLNGLVIRRFEGPDGFWAAYGLGVVDDAHFVEIISLAPPIPE